MEPGWRAERLKTCTGWRLPEEGREVLRRLAVGPAGVRRCVQLEPEPVI